ncbi:VOC family protein [Amycolatopsis sp. NPDC047767]|uniref:VOC family protein n=1 Tax=Amycolatopsis sp. NPDC047767 TaxID=3156765 RepID=UPI003455B738
MSEPNVSSPARLIDHVAVVTADADRTAAWYQRTLGLRVVRDEFVVAADIRLVWLYPDGIVARGVAAAVQVVEPGESGAARTFLEQHGEGLHHICFAVDDIEAALRDVGQSAKNVFVGGYGLPCAFLTDAPGRTVIEFVQRPTIV